MSQTILITALSLPSIIVTTPTLPLVDECHHLVPDTSGSDYSHCFKFPNSVTAVSTVRSDLKSIHRALHGAGRFSHKFISHNIGKKYGFRTLPVWVSRS